MEVLFIVKKNNSEKGFIYVEVLIATIILAMATTGIMAMYQQSSLTNKKTNEIAIATNLAKGTIETLKQFEGSKRNSSNWTNGYPQTVTQNSIAYTINVNQINASQLPTTPIDIKSDNDIVPITVTINWNSTQNGTTQAKNVSLATYFMQ